MLKPGGSFILTTPNADAALTGPRRAVLVGIEYSAHGVRRCARPRPRFDVALAWGFSNSLLTELDTIIGVDQAQGWGGDVHEQPGLASKRDRSPPRERTTGRGAIGSGTTSSDAPELMRVGPWSEGTARWRAMGATSRCRPRMPVAQPCPSRATGRWSTLWCDPWSGVARVDVDGEGGRAISTLPARAGEGRAPRSRASPHLLQIAPTGRRHPPRRAATIHITRR